MRFGREAANPRPRPGAAAAASERGASNSTRSNMSCLACSPVSGAGRPPRSDPDSNSEAPRSLESAASEPRTATPTERRARDKARIRPATYKVPGGHGREVYGRSKSSLVFAIGPVQSSGRENFQSPPWMGLSATQAVHPQNCEVTRARAPRTALETRGNEGRSGPPRASVRAKKTPFHCAKGVFFCNRDGGESL